ncbi:MAG: nitrate reductase subunit alpha [Gammaproteobacteria bacterium]|jgi:nitrate reductase alpha subunit|nr:nitrate reductase subunit alpha [Gammaproteobacteria bacterium]MBP6050792.1 nitrate reductase subunit alpha [Pseudomonadales bacterium]MBK6584420.1 nitrate reductase subunit alpha [Gammaproteobacteria bacterium]MBK7727876.1 nitrate reductase subunit alpha [Gammaproteobacteria bacterium]MBK8309054.1 nitrate reductase subunit alpha [Gammaproteobacteria bacterium]
MSYFLDRLNFLKPRDPEFSDGHGVTKSDDRSWENAYRARWQHDKIVRSTHGVNCTGSCSWKIYVKNGLVTWETQQTDYPRTRPDLPNHEPRGCPRGASYSWYLYSANRLKYPMLRGALLRLWREARRTLAPVDAWASIVGDPEKTRAYKTKRGMGGFVRVRWEEANELIAASNLYTAKKWGPDRVIGFSPIPAMSMVSYAAGSRYLSLFGGTCLSFYDWYCDLPPASPQVWGEQTDVPESADWYNSRYLIAWGSNVPQTRTPDAHFFTEARYNGTKTVAITPDYAEVAKLCDVWMHPKQGTDAALAMAFGHVILREFHLDEPSEYFRAYCRQYSDMPLLVRLEPRADGGFVSGRYLRASDLANCTESNNPEWKTLAWDELSDAIVVPTGSVGFRWGEDGKWNIEEKSSAGDATRLRLSLEGCSDEIVAVAFPYFGGVMHEKWNANVQQDVLRRNIPARTLRMANGETWHVATVYDLQLAQYGLDRGFGGDYVARGYDDDVPGTPAWAESITGVPRAQIIEIGREFGRTAHKTRGRSMIIVGAGMNHWYHNDMNYRGLINLVVMCGCVGQTGGGWAHYVGQEKLRPQSGWLPLAFGLDWSRPPRQMNGTSFWYFNSDQWRYEKLDVSEILSPLADPEKYRGSLADYNLRAIRMGWLPSAPQLNCNPLALTREAVSAGADITSYALEKFKSGELDFAYADPDAPQNFPRNLFIWRSNLLGSSGKGHEYMLKHLLGTRHGLQGKDLGERGARKPDEITWRDPAPEGKLDLLVTLDFRMCTTALYSDVVLPTATWYEKNDLNTSDMHPFIHPLSKAVDPAWEARSDWDIFKGIAHAVSELAPGVLDAERDLVLVPTLHDSPGELAMPEVLDWKRGECEAIPGKTMPSMVVVERNYPDLYKKFTSLGPLLDKLGNWGKGLVWDTNEEINFLGDLNQRVTEEGVSKGRPRIESAIDAAEVILSLAPETNGHVAVKAWSALGKFTGRAHTHLAEGKEHEAIRFRDVQAQPRKIISSPVWSGLEDEHVSYNAGYTNVHELIPWRTLTGRQQFYQDHEWMRAFGEGLMGYRPPVQTKTIGPMLGKKPNGNTEIVLNWITPHQKWGIHSTYSDNLLMQTLSRGGPIVWLSEDDARSAGIVDNDWIELFNVNGAIAARAVVSQRVMPGMAMMYHAQERIINVPGSEITGTRGGIHNSVTRVVVKPTHMIGSYAQLSYGFNYYGTTGTNRDEFVIVRKMNQVDWLDGEPVPPPAQEAKR